MSAPGPMTFAPPSEEAMLLQETADRFVAARYGLSQRSAMLGDDPGRVPRHWRDFAELGWLAAPVPEAAGGLGLPAPDLLPLLQSLGAGLVLEPYGPVMVGAAPALAAVLPADAARRALAPVIDGTRIEVLADAGPGARPLARRGADGWVLSGTVPIVAGGAAAETLWVAAETEDGAVLLRVPGSEAGIERFRLLDGQAAARLRLDGVSAPEGAALGPVSEALRDAADRALFARLAEASGVIDAMYRATLSYVGERAQFGRPIGRFQVVQHRMADMFVAREEAQSLARLAAEAMEAADPAARRRLLAAARVKVFDAGRAVLRDAIQLHGGMGLSDEMAVGHQAKRLLALDQQGPARRDALALFRGAA